MLYHKSVQLRGATRASWDSHTFIGAVVCLSILNFYSRQTFSNQLLSPFIQIVKESLSGRVIDDLQFKQNFIQAERKAFYEYQDVPAVKSLVCTCWWNSLLVQSLHFLKTCVDIVVFHFQWAGCPLLYFGQSLRTTNEHIFTKSLIWLVDCCNLEHKLNQKIPQSTSRIIMSILCRVVEV